MAEDNSLPTIHGSLQIKKNILEFELFAYHNQFLSRFHITLSAYDTANSSIVSSVSLVDDTCLIT